MTTDMQEEIYIIRLNAPSGSGYNARRIPYSIPSRLISHLKSLFPSSANENAFVRNTQTWGYPPEIMRQFYRKHRPAFDENLHQQNLTYTINNIKPAPSGHNPLPRQQDPRFNTNNKFVCKKGEVFGLFLPIDIEDETPHHINLRYMEDFQNTMKVNFDFMEPYYRKSISIWKKLTKLNKKNLIYFAQNGQEPTDIFAKFIGLNNIKELQKALYELERVSIGMNRNFADVKMKRITMEDRATLRQAFEKWPEQIEEFLNETSFVQLSTTLKAYFYEKENIARKRKKSTNGVEEAEKEVESAQNQNRANESQIPNSIEPMIEQAPGSSQTSQPMESNGCCSKNIKTSTMTFRQAVPYFRNTRESNKRQRVPDTQISKIRHCIDEKFDKDMRQYMERKNSETMKILQNKFENWNIDWETHKNVILEPIPPVITETSDHSRLIMRNLDISLNDAQSLVNMKARIDEKLRNDFIKENFDKITVKQKIELENAFDKCNLDFVKFKRDVSHMKLSTPVIEHFFHVRNKQHNQVKMPKGNDDAVSSRTVQRAAENSDINKDDQDHYEFPESNQMYLSYTDEFGFHIPRGENSPDHTESSRASSSSKDGEANTTLEEVARSEPPRKIARHRDAHNDHPAGQINSPGLSQPEENGTMREMDLDSEQNENRHGRGVEFDNPTVSEERMEVVEVPVLQLNEAEVAKNPSTDPIHPVQKRKDLRLEAVKITEDQQKELKKIFTKWGPHSSKFDKKANSFNLSKVERKKLVDEFERKKSNDSVAKKHRSPKPMKAKVLNPLIIAQQQSVSEPSQTQETAETQRKIIDIDEVYVDSESNSENPDNSETDEHQQDFESPTAFEQLMNDPSTLPVNENEVINDGPVEAPSRHAREKSNPSEFEQLIAESSALHAIEDEIINDDPLAVPSRPEREESHTTDFEQPVDETLTLHEYENEVINDSPEKAANPPEREEPHPTEFGQTTDESAAFHDNENEVMNDDPLEKVSHGHKTEESHPTESEQPIERPSAFHEIENEVIDNDPLEAPNRQEREESPEIIYMGTDAYTGPAPRPAPSIPESQRKPRLVPESILTRIPDGATEEWELWTREQVLQWSSLFLDTEGQRFYMKKKNFTGLSMAEFLDKKDWDDFDSRSPINGIYISLRANLNRIINHRNGWTFD